MKLKNRFSQLPYKKRLLFSIAGVSLYYPGSGFWNFGGVGIWYVDPERKQAFDTADERCER
ncbi:MAG: hypothetical protein ACLUE8_05455 [Lachnospiraceae bacterium]